MKLEKKHWIIIGVVVAILVWYFLLRKKTEKAESSWSRTKNTSGTAGKQYYTGRNVEAGCPRPSFPCTANGKDPSLCCVFVPNY